MLENNKVRGVRMSRYIASCGKFELERSAEKYLQANKEKEEDP